MLSSFMSQCSLLVVRNPNYSTAKNTTGFLMLDSYALILYDNSQIPHGYIVLYRTKKLWPNDELETVIQQQVSRCLLLRHGGKPPHYVLKRWSFDRVRLPTFRHQCAILQWTVSWKRGPFTRANCSDHFVVELVL